MTTITATWCDDGNTGHVSIAVPVELRAPLVIERSDDRGHTWAPVFRVVSAPEAPRERVLMDCEYPRMLENVRYRVMHPDSTRSAPVPVDGLPS